MHFNFAFTTVQILWTLTFAAELVLLVVLLGRDRARLYPWFTASIVLVALRHNRLLYRRHGASPYNAILITMGLLAAIVGLMVLVELARKAFGGVRRLTAVVWTLVLLALGGGVLAVWGAWPSWKTLTADSSLAALAIMQLAAQKGSMLADVLTVELGLLVIVFGRRFAAGWRTHTQQIVIGLSTASLGQLAVQGIWQLIALKAVPHSQGDIQRIIGLREKLFNGNGVLYAAVVVWWIVCLWIDEPGTAAAENLQDVAPPGPENES